jgi:UDP-GlcNAc3NAcA epimerase
MLIVTIAGTRPQFIKAAALSPHLRCRASEIFVHTGQHYDDNMSRVFFDELDLPVPAYNLAVGSGHHGMQTGRMLEAIENVLLDLRPDCVLVYGDTNSTLAGALAAAKLHIPVAHVEAGLRSHNRTMPEEINRIATDHISDLLFAPTEAAADNLRREGIAPASIHRTGDVMYDAALRFGPRAEERSAILQELGLAPKSYVLATIHRAGNVDDPARLEAIYEGLERVAATLPVVWPVHPRTRPHIDAIRARRNGRPSPRMIAPLGYLDMVMLEKNARLIVTDSGGVQKEAFFYNVPCLTLREETEWVELVELGWNRLCPPFSASAVHAGILSALDMAGVPAQPYGPGDAGAKVAAILCQTTFSPTLCRISATTSSAR